MDKAEEFLKEHTLSTYYDEVALPGLKLAQNDIARGALDRLQTERIKAAVIEVVEDLADQDDGRPERRDPSDHGDDIDPIRKDAAGSKPDDCDEQDCHWYQKGEDTPVVPPLRLVDGSSVRSACPR